MPGRGPPDARLLGDEMAGPQADVRSDKRFDEVEHRVGEQEVEQAAVGEVGRVQLVGAFARREGRDVLLEQRGQPGQRGRREDRGVVEEVALPPVRRGVISGDRSGKTLTQLAHLPS